MAKVVPFSIDGLKQVDEYFKKFMIDQSNNVLLLNQLIMMIQKIYSTKISRIKRKTPRDYMFYEFVYFTLLPCLLVCLLALFIVYSLYPSMPLSKYYAKFICVALLNILSLINRLVEFCCKI